MNNIEQFAQNLKVWSRRIGIPNLGHKASEIAYHFKGDLGEQSAIRAVAAEWFYCRGLERALCWELSGVAAVDVYHGIYCPDEPSPAIGLDEAILSNSGAMAMLEQFCQMARKVYRQDKEYPVDN